MLQRLFSLNFDVAKLKLIPDVHFMHNYILFEFYERSKFIKKILGNVVTNDAKPAFQGVREGLSTSILLCKEISLH